jgi:diadenylate cyclase
MLLGAQIGFLPISIWDLLDILIVGFLLYQIYRLLRGNIAMNIFLGVLLLYVVYWLVRQLDMQLLSWVLDKFVSVGVIIIVIIFQQEIRRFLLFLGKNALKQRSNPLFQFLDIRPQDELLREKEAQDLLRAAKRLSEKKTGALIILAKSEDLEGIVLGGTEIDAKLSEAIIESIFQKNSPLHDGAMLVRNGRVLSAGCVLPLSDRSDLPAHYGLRHRAAIGLSERVDAGALVVSEESGTISWVQEGKIRSSLGEEELQLLLAQNL